MRLAVSLEVEFGSGDRDLSSKPGINEIKDKRKKKIELQQKLKSIVAV